MKSVLVNVSTVCKLKENWFKKITYLVLKAAHMAFFRYYFIRIILYMVIEPEIIQGGPKTGKLCFVCLNFVKY